MTIYYLQVVNCQFLSTLLLIYYLFDKKLLIFMKMSLSTVNFAKSVIGS